MRLHHVGIVCPDASLLDVLKLAARNEVGGGDGQPLFKHVPEFQCDCYLLGQIELVVPNGPRKEGTPLYRWLQGRGRSLHHIAFEVTDLEAKCDALRQSGVPVVLDEPVDGVGGMRVNFIHPSYCGFLLEVVEPGGGDR